MEACLWGRGYSVLLRGSHSVQVIEGTQQLSAPLRTVLTIGNFDGVHRGHRELIRRTIALAGELGVPSAAFTFHPAPQEVLRPDGGAPRLQTLDQRLRSFAETGLTYVVVERFTRELGALGAVEFASQILRDRVGVQGLVLGHDFRFGRGRSGNATVLAEHLSIPVQQVAAVLEEGEPISSSRIRTAVGAGEMRLAAQLLGRPHVVEGRVEHGEKRGRKIGFPTANLTALQGLLPHYGVYAVRAHVQGSSVPAVANLGTRPTFDGRTPSLEVHLLDFEGDLYGQPLALSFVERLRAEQRFASVDELVSAIGQDVAAARSVLQ